MASPTVIGTTGATFGLTAESGILCQRVTVATEAEKASILDNNGNETTIAYFNPKQAYTVAGKTIGTIGTTGVLAAVPGVSVTVANAIANTAVTSANAIYVDRLEFSKSATEFQDFSMSATKYAVIS